MITDDFDQLNQINHYRHRLDDIRDMHTELATTPPRVTSYSMDLAGPAATTEPPLPGGETLILTGPWASDATYGDDTPHPAQTIIEWAHTTYDAHNQTPPARLRFTQALTYLREQTPWILTSPWATAWRTDIDAVHARLATHCPPEVDHHHDDRTPDPTISAAQLWEALEEHPHHELTRRDLTHLGIHPSTITTWRHRGQLTEARPGHYRAADILNIRDTA